MIPICDANREKPKFTMIQFNFRKILDFNRIAVEKNARRRNNFVCNNSIKITNHYVLDVMKL